MLQNCDKRMMKFNSRESKEDKLLSDVPHSVAGKFQELIDLLAKLKEN